MDDKNRYIRFDWAMKHMLRDKANFGILEGLISVLLNDDVKIIELLESEGNQTDADDKFNRVDIKAKNSEGHIIIVEVQLTSQLHYLERILYGVCKTVTEHISLGDDYDKVKKVYSISILYCNYGSGSDYVYHGETVFRGIHSGDVLSVPMRQRGVIINRFPREVFPEFYVVRVNSFDKIPESPLDEWLSYLKTGDVNENATAPGLEMVRTKLKLLNMTPKEKKEYVRHMENVAYQKDVFASAHAEGHAKGVLEGRAEGHAEGRAEGFAEGVVMVARSMKSKGMDTATIAELTSLPGDVIDGL